MRNSSATEPVRLLSPWALLLIGGLVGTLLVVTYNGDEVFMPSEGQPDAVSISYAELLLEAHPDDASLRLKLIEQLIALGDHVRARSHVFKLDEAASGDVRFFLAELAVLEAQANEKAVSAQTLAALSAQLRGVTREGLSLEQLARLARRALAVNDPSLAAQTYLDLAERDEARRQQWFGEAVTAHLAAGETGAAARLLNEMIARADGADDRQRYVSEAFSAYVAADQGDRAATVVHANLDVLDAADGALFEAAVKAGIGSQRHDLAADILARWRLLDPENVTALRSEMQLRLASGQLEQAWAVGQQLANVAPQSPETLETMAKLGEWTGRPSEALGYWLKLLQQQDGPQVREHAWRLAAQLFDFDNTIQLLAGAGQSRQLSDAELDALVYSHGQRGTPEQAERWLRRYLSAHPDHSLAWERLQQLLEQTQQLEAQVALWAERDRQFGVSLEQRLTWAHVHWELFDVQAAWVVLDAVDRQQVSEPAYWLLRAELAWELERDEDALEGYQRLQALGVANSDTVDERLIALYERHAPARALDVMMASWERKRTPANLTRALQWAMQLDDLPRLRLLVEQGLQMPESERVGALWSARARLAVQAGEQAEAERLLVEAVARLPHADAVKEQLLWHYIDTGNKAALTPLLQRWEPLAHKRSSLWLPYASGYLLLNRNELALQWFDRFLRRNPDDLLVQAAYADALDNAGYFDRALRLRRHLAGLFDGRPATAEPDTYRTYLRLLSAGGAGIEMLLRLDRPDARPMLQIWFDQFSEQLERLNQPALKDEWLGWARRNGLRIDRYAELQQALRAHNASELERLLASGGLDPAQRVEALQQLGASHRALSESLAALSPDQPDALQQQLRGQALALQARHPQGLQIGLRRQDFGTLELRGQTAEIARQFGRDWHASAHFSRQRYSGPGLSGASPGVERSAELQLTRELGPAWLGAALEISDHDEGDRQGAGVFGGLQLTDTDSLEFHADWHRQAEESGLARALARRDSVGVSATHGLTARDQFSWSLAQQRFSTLDGEALGHGHQLNLEFSHALFFEGPSWTLRSGLTHAAYRLADGPLHSVPQEPADYLQERFGQVYVASTWRRGFPGALNRETPQYSWLVDVLAGWQWTEQQVGYAINAGVGTRLLGDDELAFTLGYQSAPRNGDGEPGGTLSLTYSTRFGR